MRDPLGEKSQLARRRTGEDGVGKVSVLENPTTRNNKRGTEQGTCNDETEKSTLFCQVP